MRIVIPTIGSRGDVQPFIALSQGLMRAGHAVKLASHPMMKPLVEYHGVPFAAIGPDIDLAREVAAIRRHSRNAAVGLIRGMRFGFDMLERSHEDILALCKDADVVVVPTAVAAGKNEAELLDLPYLSVTLMPWAIPWTDPERTLIRRVVYGAIDGLVSFITTRPLNRIRKQQGLPPVGEEGFTSPYLNLIPVSRVVYALNPHWAPRHRLVGYWFVEERGDWQPPEELLDFLEQGEPPLVISLGAMSLGEEDAVETAGLFVEAVQEADVRAIVLGWEAGMRELMLPPTIYSAGSLPHSWLLRRSAGVVHHGGFGTTAAGLQAGIPALVIPHLADQFYWGQRVYELGLGPQPIRRTRLEVEGLTVALNELVGNETLGLTASRLGEEIRTERGVEVAVHLIEERFC
jgi:sterol 3beta-glucosyltransferase